MQDWVWVIQLLSAVGVATAAVFAWRSSKAAGKSAEATEKTVLAQIVIQITDTYSSPDMDEAIKYLHNWKDGHGTEFAKIFSNRLAEGGHSDAEQLDKHRRRYSHHFHQIKTMLDCEVVNEDFVGKLVKPSQVDTLLDVVEPLEKAKGLDYDHSTFDLFRRIYRKES